MIFLYVTGESRVVIGPSFENDCDQGSIKANGGTECGGRTVSMLLESVSILEGRCIYAAGGFCVDKGVAEARS